jgi:hypothetical protein
MLKLNDNKSAYAIAMIMTTKGHAQQLIIPPFSMQKVMIATKPQQTPPARKVPQ